MHFSARRAQDAGTKADYIHRNPVRAVMVEKEDFQSGTVVIGFTTSF